MASHCPACGRVLELEALESEAPCCTAVRRGEPVGDLLEPFRPEDFGLPRASEVAPPSPPSPVVSLRPRLVAPPAATTPTERPTDSSAEPEPDPAAAPRVRSRRLPAGIRLVIPRRARRAPSPSLSARREVETQPPAPSAPTVAEVAAPSAPPPVVEAPAPPQRATEPAPSMPSMALRPRPADPVVATPERRGAFGPLGQAHAAPTSASPPAPALPVVHAPVRVESLRAEPPRQSPPQPIVAAPAPAPAAAAPAAPAAPAPVAPASLEAPPSAQAPRPIPRPRPAQPIRPRSERPQQPSTPPRPPPRRRVDLRGLGRALAQAAARLTSAPAAMPDVALGVAAAAMSALLLWLAPPLAAAGLAGLALAVADSRDEARSKSALRLGWTALGVALLTAGLGVASTHGLRLPVPDSPLPWPPALLVPAAAIGLAVVAALGLRLAAAGSSPWLAAVAGPLAAAGGVLALDLRFGGVLLAGCGLVALASSACWIDDRPRIARALAAWAVGGAVAVAAVAGAATLGRRPGVLACWCALALLVPAGAGVAARLSRSYVERRQRVGRLLGAAVLVGVAVVAATGALVAGFPLAIGLALAPLAAIVALAAALVQERRGLLRIETPWLVRDARVAAAASLAVSLAGLAPGAGASPWSVATALALLAVVLVLERALGAAAWSAGGAWLLAVASGLSVAAGAGAPVEWLPLPGAVALAAVGLAATRTRLGMTREEWTPFALAGLGACLVGGVASCALGQVAAGLAGACASAAAPLALAGRRGVVDLGRSLLAGHLPEGRRASFVAALQLSVVAFLPLAPLVAAGLQEWAAPVLAGEALVACSLSRIRPTLVHPASWLVIGSGALLPLLAQPGGWLPGGVALALLAATGLVELGAARKAPRGTHRVAAELAVAAGLGTIAWAAAGLQVAPIVLLGACVGAQALDVLVDDACLGVALRRAAVVAWLAALGIGLARAVVVTFDGCVLLLGAAVAAGLLGMLRRQRWPLLAAGLAACASLACGLLLIGVGALEHPTLHAAPTAALLVTWGVFESRRGAAANAWLAAGLGALVVALALDAHLPGAPAILRVVAWLGGGTIAAAGLATRHRIPVVTGGALVALELAWLLADGVRLGLGHVAVAAAVGGALLAAIAAGAWYASWRVGGRAALAMAWSSDAARLLAAWRTWS